MMNKSVLFQTIDKSEMTSNVYSFKCMFILTAIIATTVLLNILNIFIVDDKLMYTSLLGCVIATFAASILVKFFNRYRITKYILMFAMVIMVTILGVLLTYHIILICCIPILCAAQYKSKKMVYYTYGVSVVSMFVIVMMGYYYGLCDANMLMLTTSTSDNYIDFTTGELLFTQANINPWQTLPLYFVFPRCLIMYVMIPLIRHITDVMTEHAVRERELKKLSETDTMTQLYNKNKYLTMVKEYYPDVDTIGVLFWDVNDLKVINDSMGHEYGDYLISTIASSIMENLGENTMAYRTGGDEFVVVMENATEDNLQQLINRCKTSISIKNKASKMRLSAAVGYALGAGKDLEAVVAQADANMYLDKKKTKKEAE